MKTLEELKRTPHLCIKGKLESAPDESEVYFGWIDIEGFIGTVVFGFNEHGIWEHVSISHNNKHRLPTWENMCRVKEMFWGKDVTVVQWHPAEDSYIHGIMGMDTNILHLWRPKNGDWSIVNEDLMKNL